MSVPSVAVEGRVAISNRYLLLFCEVIRPHYDAGALGRTCEAEGPRCFDDRGGKKHAGPRRDRRAIGGSVFPINYPTDCVLIEPAGYLIGCSPARKTRSVIEICPFEAAVRIDGIDCQKGTALIFPY